MNYDSLNIVKNFPQGNPYSSPEARKSFLQKMSTLDYRIEDKVKYCLSLFGWTGKKRPEAKQVIQGMTQLQYYVFPAAQIFLERFGGLHIKFDGDASVFLFTDSFDILDFCFCEALQTFKNELLIPVGKQDELQIFLGESGRVHYWISDTTGIIPANMFSVLSSMVFDLEKDIWFLTTPQDRQEVIWWDGDLMDRIEAEVNSGTYISYAQKRFAKNGGIENPIMAKDSFTQWLLSLSEK